MREADEYQQVIKRMVGIAIVMVAVTLGMFTSRIAASDTLVQPPVKLVVGEETVVPSPEKRQQFRAKLLRNWWPTRQPRYIIYRPLFQKS